MHGGELLEDAARGQSRGERIEAAGEGHVEAIGEEGDKDLPLGLTPARNWPVKQGPSGIDLAYGVDWGKSTIRFWATKAPARAAGDPLCAAQRKDFALRLAGRVNATNAAMFAKLANFSRPRAPFW